MEKTINLTKHSVLKHTHDMIEICRPLSTFFSVTYFNHIRQFLNNTRVCLTNHGEWVEHVCNEKLYLIAPFEERGTRYQPGYVLWNAFKDNQVYQSALNCFNIDHGITFIEKYDSYTDFYHFGTQKDLSSNVEFYLQLIEELKLFIHYYKDKAHKLIANSDLLVFPELKSISESAKSTINFKQALPADIKKDFRDTIKVQRFYLGGEMEQQYLTTRELECVRWLLMGKSAEEIAMILNVTPRTSITHIKNIKAKFGCNKVSQLVFKLANGQISNLLQNECVN